MVTEAGQRFLKSLNHTERNILAFMCGTGGSNDEIALRFRLNEQVAKNAVRSLLRKAGLTNTNRTKLVVFAYQNGVVACPCRRKP